MAYYAEKSIRKRRRYRNKRSPGGFKSVRFLILLAVGVFVSLKISEATLSPDSFVRSSLADYMEDGITPIENWLKARLGIQDTTGLIEKQNEDLSHMTPIKPSYVLRPPDAIDFNED